MIGRENGYVSNSTVTAGSNGYAQFQLSVPSSDLQATMTALSRLQYATVASRTDATQDVNGEYLGDLRAAGRRPSAADLAAEAARCRHHAAADR